MMRGNDRRHLSAKQVIAIVVGALVLAAVLDAEGLHETADRQPFGWRRTAALRLVAPALAMGRTLRLDAPAKAVEAARTSEDDVPPVIDVRRVIAAPVPTPGPEPKVEAAAKPAARAKPLGHVPKGISMWIAGDSVSGLLGQALTNHVASKDGEAKAEFRLSTGLARPDAYPWHKRISNRMAELDPKAVVLMFGANDNQPVKVDGRSLPFGSDAWRKEYGRRVGAVMDMLVKQNREVYWVGQPIMRDGGYSGQIMVLNSVYKFEAKEREGVDYISSWEVFADGDGRYTAYLPDADGRPVKVRADDGVHLTHAGGRRLAAVVLKTMQERKRAAAEAAEPTPQPTAQPTPQPTAQPTPEPTPKPKPKPTPKPTPTPAGPVGGLPGA